MAGGYGILLKPCDEDNFLNLLRWIKLGKPSDEEFIPTLTWLEKVRIYQYKNPGCKE